MKVSSIKVNDVFEFESGFDGAYHLICVDIEENINEPRRNVHFVVWDGTTLELDLYDNYQISKYKLRLI